MDISKENIKHLADRIGKVYKPIFSRGYLLLADADNEWKTFVAENQSHIVVRSNYFVPMLILLIIVHVVSVLMSAFFDIGEEKVGLFEHLCSVFFNTIMLSLLCYTLSCIVVKVIFSIESIRWVYFGENFDLNKSSMLLVFPYCLSMFSQILENLWNNFFFMNFVTMVLSYIIVWKGLVYIVPEFLAKNPSRHIWITLIIGSVPVILNKICMKLLTL